MTNQANRPVVYIMLGSHLDLFWMGTHRECLERGTEIQRAALDLLEQYPEYRYYIETTIFAEYHLRRFPQDRKRMQRLLDAGRLEIGASFVDRVEHAHSGESLIRHAQEGVRWQMETFGREPLTAAHPDLPGISPQVPQVYTRAGVQAYLRARGFGSVYDWRAPDGSRVLYCNLFGYGEKTLEALQALLNEPIQAEAILIRGGYGDLQEPSARVLEHISTLRQRFPERRLALVSPGQVLDALRAQRLPELSGEMPYGWGSLASAFVRIMAQSVELEHTLLTAEKLQALALALGIDIPLAPPPKPPVQGWDYSAIGRIQGDIWGDLVQPGDELRQLWRYELLCQDHNYGGRHGAQSNWDREVMRAYAIGEAGRIAALYLHALAGPGREERVAVFNPLSWECREPVYIADDEPAGLRALDAAGSEVPSQPGDGGLWVLTCLAPLGVHTLHLARTEPAARVNRLASRTLRGNGLRLELDQARGCAVSLYADDFGELLEQQSGTGLGELVSFHDSGMDVRYTLSDDALSDTGCRWEVLQQEDGALFNAVTIAGEFLQSRVEKTFRLWKHTSRLDLNLRLWWWGKRGEHFRLRFPLQPLGHRETWYGVPFYAMRWPEMLQGPGISDAMTLDQGLTSDDMLLPHDCKHFREVIGWLDASYAEQGVTLATRHTCWWIDGARLEASILRTQWSCGDANLWNENPGLHTWRFSLYPHHGNWREAQAWRRGEEALNPPLTDHLEAGAKVAARALGDCLLTPGTVQVSALHKSRIVPGAVCLRLLECTGSPCEAALRLPFAAQRAEEVDLLERPLGDIPVCGTTIRLALGAWQFRTLRLYPETP